MRIETVPGDIDEAVGEADTLAAPTYQTVDEVEAEEACYPDDALEQTAELLHQLKQQGASHDQMWVAIRSQRAIWKAAAR